MAAERDNGIPVGEWPDPRLVDGFPYDFDLRAHTVYAGLMGSASHGTYVPKEDPDSIDDVDIMAIVVPSRKWLIGLHAWDHWVKQKDELDVVVYSLRKFVGLLLKGVAANQDGSSRPSRHQTGPMDGASASFADDC